MKKMLIVIGTVLLVLGFNYAASAWSMCLIKAIPAGRPIVIRSARQGLPECWVCRE